MDELMALSYLDAVVRETLRLHAPVPSTIRIAMKDDILPVDTPFTDKYGVVHNGIKYVANLPFNDHQYLITVVSGLARATRFSSPSWQSTDRRRFGAPMQKSSILTAGHHFQR
jgi:Cytochrome P450